MSHALLIALVPLVAFAIDWRWGEPPARWHPVVWMGWYLERAGRWIAPLATGAASDSMAAGVSPPESGRIAACEPDTAMRAGDNRSSMLVPDVAGTESCAAADSVASPVWLMNARAFIGGTLAWLLGACLVMVAAVLVEHAIMQLPAWLAVPLMALCLKPLFAWSMLRTLVAQVGDALHASLADGQQQLRHLVSRDVTALSETEVRESAIETLAENLSDSVVAPLFWFALFGLPGAALYRWANTADAMWGYPGERGGRNWAWAGKWAARADDVLNLIPARLTALMLMMGASSALWCRLPAEAQRTPSPNSGWPMAAMALRLDASLGKPGVYRLNPSGAAPEHDQLRQALRLAGRVAMAAAGLCFLVIACTGLA